MAIVIQDHPAWRPARLGIGLQSWDTPRRPPPPRGHVHGAARDQKTEPEESFVGKFLVLLDAPRELWIIYIAKLLEIVSYGLMMSTVTLWLSSETSPRKDTP